MKQLICFKLVQKLIYEQHGFHLGRWWWRSETGGEGGLAQSSAGQRASEIERELQTLAAAASGRESGEFSREQLLETINCSPAAKNCLSPVTLHAVNIETFVARKKLNFMVWETAFFINQKRRN